MRKRNWIVFFLVLCLSVEVFAEPMLGHSDTNLYFDLQEAFDKPMTTLPDTIEKQEEGANNEELDQSDLSNVPFDILEQIANDPEITDEEVQALIAPYMDPVVTPTVTAAALKGIYAFSAFVFVNVSSYVAINNLRELEQKEFYENNKGDLFTYFYEMPERSQAYFILQGELNGSRPDYEEVKKAIPTLSLEDFTAAQKKVDNPGDSVSFYAWLDGVAESATMATRRFFSFVAKCFEDCLSFLQPAPPPDFDTSSNEYRIVDFDHNYGSKARIPYRNVCIIPDHVPYKISYRSTLEKYNYGWEYIQFKVNYTFMSLENKRCRISFDYIKKLSPNQHLDMNIFTSPGNTLEQEVAYNIRFSGGTYPSGVFSYTVKKQDTATWRKGSNLIIEYLNTNLGLTMPYKDKETEFIGVLNIAPLPNVVPDMPKNGLNSREDMPIAFMNGWTEPVLYPSEQQVFTSGKGETEVGVPPQWIIENYPVFPIENPTPNSKIPIGSLATNPTKPQLMPEPEIKPEFDIPPYTEFPRPGTQPDIPTDPPVDPEIPTDPPTDVPSNFFEYIMDWMAKVWTWLTNFFTSLWQGFIDAMKRLFIPSEGYFTDAFTKSKDEAAAAFGYLNFNVMEDSLTGVGSAKPDISIMVYGKKVQLINFDYWEDHKQFLQGLIIAVVGFLLFLYNIRMVQWLIRAADQFGQSSNVNLGEGQRATKGGRFL